MSSKQRNLEDKHRNQFSGPEEHAEKSFTEEEVEVIVAAEGLTLIRSEKNACGFKGVAYDKGKVRRGAPYSAWYGDGRQHFVGRYKTVYAAALAVARCYGPEGSRAQSELMNAAEEPCP